MHGHLNFMRFTDWAEKLGVALPVGLDMADECRPCRFRLASRGGTRCSCPAFRAVPGSSAGLCECGHKISMHRSEAAESSISTFRGRTMSLEGIDPHGETGLVPVKNPELLSKLQGVLTRTHKEKDNWTRDRGCSLHGVNACSTSCCMRNRAQVPTRYTLVDAWQNHNPELWAKYSLVRSAVTEECGRDTDACKYELMPVESTMDLGSGLSHACNEWLLFHGSSLAACRGIANSNFRVDLAGTGATWKDAGTAKGTPLYGFGIYLAERITKADEYSKEVDDEEYGGLFAALICRVVGGRSNLVTTNEIDTESLQRAVFAGPYHSVFGDRVATLGKPFKEVVVYDKDQVYPEFVLVYARSFD